MSKFYIPKRVYLDFLGDDYKEAYLDFKAIPVPHFQGITDEINKASDKEADKIMTSIVKRYYRGGMFPNDAGELEAIEGDADVLDEIDVDTLIVVFGRLTGQDLKGALEEKKDLIKKGAPKEVVEAVETSTDPKSEGQSKAT